MIDDVYQAALAALRHHLDEAGTPYTVDEGELVIDSHRLGLSITFDGFVSQGEPRPGPARYPNPRRRRQRRSVSRRHVGRRRRTAQRPARGDFRVASVGRGAAAGGAWARQWKIAAPPRIPSNWPAGICSPAGSAFAAQCPPDLRAGGAFYRALLERLRQVVAKWDQPRSVYAAIDLYHGHLRPEALRSPSRRRRDGEPGAGRRAGRLAWPASSETYLYKQLFVLRHQRPSDSRVAVQVAQRRGRHVPAAQASAA